VSLWRVCVPYLTVGLAASAVLFVLNEWCVPHGSDWADRIKSRYVQKPGDAGKQAEFRNFGFTNARDHRTWFIAEYRVKTAEMLKPQVNWTLPDGRATACMPTARFASPGLDFFQRGGILTDGRKRAAVAVISNKCAGDTGIHRKTGGN